MTDYGIKGGINALGLAGLGAAVNGVASLGEWSRGANSEFRNKRHGGPHRTHLVEIEDLAPGEVKTSSAVQNQVLLHNKAKNKKSGPERPKRDQGDALFAAMPAVVANEVRFTRPHIEVSKDGCKKTVCHRVQLETPVVPTSTDFQVVFNTEIQPGLTMGDWLATESSGWEQYVMRQLRYHWVPIVGTTADGDINMILDYNPLGTPPSDSTAASENQDMVQGSIFVPHTLVARPKDLMNATGKRKWVRTALDFVGDRKTYDCGRIMLASEGCSTLTPGARLGKLWVDFVIDFYVPTTPNSQSVGFCRVAQFVLGDNQILPSAATTALVGWTERTNNVGVTVDASGVFELPQGCYKVDIGVELDTATAATASGFNTWTLQSNGTAVSNEFGGVATTSKSMTTLGSSNAKLQLTKHHVLDVGGQLFVDPVSRRFALQVITPTFTSGTALALGNVALQLTSITIQRIDE